MENNFEQLVTALNVSPLSTDVLHQITLFLKQQTDESLSSFISQSFQSLFILEQWAWQLLSQDSHQWVNEPYYQELFHTLASFNKKLVFDRDRIEDNTKGSLLYSVTVDEINNIFQHIEQSVDDNDPFITIISLWFDNHSYFQFDNPQYELLPISDHINQYIAHNYVMNKQYKLYLAELRQPQLVQSAFTAKLLFYIKTCSFYLYSYLLSKFYSFPYTADEMISYLCEDYLQIIHVHSYTVASWNKELLGCIAQLIGLVSTCCWWDGEQCTQMKILFPTEQTACDHVQDLLRIISHQPFYKQTKSVRSNNETILMDTILTFLIIMSQTENINWLFRSDTTIRDIIVSVTETSLNDEVCLFGYEILGQTLTDKELKDLKIGDNISGYYFKMLDEAWNHSSIRYKQRSIPYLLRGFRTLSSNDSIQQRTAKLNKISLFIEICDEYPSAFDIIWGLSFNQGIQQQMRSSSTFMAKLAHLAKECDNEQMRKTIHGILWNLEINHEDRSTSEIDDNKTFDIMISYSHKEKQLCKQIYDELVKSGYRVWIDFDQMHGNVMDAMAQAIEQSCAVIICMSEQYRKSNYCRAEAQYAFQRQRKIVPAILQKRYKPDGWLSFLIGQLLYIDFNKHEFPRAMKMLSNELKTENLVETNVALARPKEETNVSSIHPKETINIVSPVECVSSSSTLPQNISDWTQTQVKEWLIEHNLNQMSRLFADCNGRSLVYLSKCVKYGELRCILNSFQEESLRRLNQNLSFIEFSCFLSLMDQEKET